MTKEIRELLNKLEVLEDEARELINNTETRTEDITTKQEEIRGLKAKIEMQEELENDFKDEERDGINMNKESRDDKKVKYDGELFYRALTGVELTEEERKLIKEVQTRALSETGDKKDGGNVVPDDLSQEIIESIKEEESVRNLVRIENAKSKTGTRIVRTGTPNKLHNTAERGAIQMINNPQYDVITYNQQKFAGMMDVSNELLDDSFVNFKDEIKTWLADSSRETENEEVFYGLGGDNACEGLISKGKEKYKTVKAPTTIDIKFLRRVKNMLKKGYRTNSKWVMNTEAFEVLSNIEDKNGRGILAEDPRKEDSYTLFGRPVEIYDTIQTNDTTKKTEILFGDFIRGYRMFPRKNFEIKMTDIGAGAFETDTVKAIGIERFDGKIMDVGAVIMVTDVVTGEVTPTQG